MTAPSNVAPSGEPAAAAPKTGRSLRHRVLAASVWTVGGQVADRILHLGSNLVLTRLLFPEAFGVMAMVNAVVLGLGLISDVGIGPSIIREKRGLEPGFLNTAWTIQVVRGFALWAIAALLAWPLSRQFGEPSLAALIPAAAVTATIAGFNAVNMHTWRRKLELWRVTTIELAASVVSVLATIALALAWRSVWALALGSIAGATVKLVWSHAWSEHPHRLHWDADVARSMYRFGRWIFLSTFFTWLTTQGDRLLMGNLLSLNELGQYAIATLMLKSLVQTVTMLANRVLFPMYSEIGQETTPQLQRYVTRIRMMVTFGVLPPLWILTVAGDQVIGLLYDARYQEAGWMLQILAGGSIFRFLSWIGPLNLARGESFIGLMATGPQGAVLLAGIWIGHAVAGTFGTVIGIAASYFVYYPVQVWLSRRYGVWSAAQDLLAIGLSALAVLGGLALRASFG